MTLPFASMQRTGRSFASLYRTLMPFIVGEEKAAVGYKDRSEALRAEMSHWYGKIKWWMHLKRAGFVPQYEVWKRKD